MEFSLSMTMFELLETEYRGEICAGDLINNVGQVVKMVGQYVCEKTVHTKTNKRMWFGNFLDVERNTFCRQLKVLAAFNVGFGTSGPGCFF
jgi:hypothetical protein